MWPSRSSIGVLAFAVEDRVQGGKFLQQFAAMEGGEMATGGDVSGESARPNRRG